MRQEIPYVHLLRVLACMMVVFLHSLPANPTSGLDSYFSYAVWLAVRPCVPLFLMITGVLLLPLQAKSQIEFYKKRITRIVFPLLIWGMVYSVLPFFLGIENINQLVKNVCMLPIDFPHEVGGILWYLYILIGLYLIIPYINPAVFEDIKMIKIYIILWIFASFIGFIRCYEPQFLEFGPSSDFDMLLYFSGLLGYLFLGKYLSNNTSTWRNRGGLILIYIVSVILIDSIRNSINEKNISGFLSLPVIFMASSLFIFLKDISINTHSKLYKVITNISSLSFGIYLSHMVVHRCVSIYIYEYSTSPIAQLLVMSLNFCGAYLITYAVKNFRLSKYIIG